MAITQASTPNIDSLAITMDGVWATLVADMSVDSMGSKVPLQRCCGACWRSKVLLGLLAPAGHSKVTLERNGQKCCALCCCALPCFAPCMDIHWSTLEHVYIYILVWTRAYPCTEQSSAECSSSEHSATETSFCEQRSRTARSKSLFERTGGTEAGSNSLFERTGGTGQARTAFSSAFLSLFAPF